MYGQRWRGTRLTSWAVVLVLCAIIGACSGLGSRKESNPQVYGLYDRIPEGGGAYKVGNSYQVEGQRFQPREDPTYNRIGVASWYGEYFHGRKTANGEFYDMNRLSAAHPTLPLPIYVRVTNLQNDRSLVVRVNDRGPFKRDRIIDLSKAAATELGFLRDGTAQVRVTYITDAPLEGDIPDMQTADRGYGYRNPMSTGSIKSDPVATGSVAPPAKLADQVPASAAPARTGTEPLAILPQGFYVQAASFRSEQRARTLAEELAHLGVFDILPIGIGQQTFYQVRSGPLATIDDARKTAAGVAGAGLGDAQIIRR